MLRPAGAWGYWQNLPIPAKLAIGFLAFMAFIWIRDSFGASSVAVALVLWGIAGVGILHASGGLEWVDRHPKLARLLDAFAPRLAVRPEYREERTFEDVPQHPVRKPSQASGPTVAIPDLSGFVGLENVVKDVERLVATRASWVQTVAPATLVLLVGPRGTGKTSLALTLVAKLYAVGGLQSGRILQLSAAEIPALRGAYGPTEAGMTAVRDRIQAALDGTLLIDDLDSLIGSSEASTFTEIGTRILNVARLYPGRLFVVATGSTTAADRLDPSNRWLGQFNVRWIEFQHLGLPDMEKLFIRLLEKKKLSLASDAGRALKIQIGERRTQGGDDFDNAYAIGRLLDDVVQSQALRIHENPALPKHHKSIITADDVRNAPSSL